MKLTVEHRGQRYRIDVSKGVSLAIELDFAGSQPAFYGVEKARTKALEIDGFVGDMAGGGSCRVERLELIPHCHGTHTESVAHISQDHLDPPRPPAWMAARIVSVSPDRLDQSGEHYPAPGQSHEAVISRAALAAFEVDTAALIVRTLPNDSARRERRYLGENSHPYFTLEAVDWLVAQGIEHLLVDTPSIDRAHDDGSLPAHRRFWALDDQRHSTDRRALARTLSEFLFVPDSLVDGLYLLNLQLPDWRCDAIPSRPLVFPLTGSEP